MELFQMKPVQSELDVYSSQRHLVDTEIYSIDDDTSISVKDIIQSPTKSSNSRKKPKKITIGKLQDNLFQANEKKSDESQLLSDSSSHDKNDSPKSHNIVIHDDLNNDASNRVREKSASSRNSEKNYEMQRRNASDADEIENSLKSVVSEEIEIKKTDNFRITGIHIYKCDMLKQHPFLMSCNIKIDIYNYEEGKSLNNNKHYKAIIQTQVWKSLNKRYEEPQWNELVLFENVLMKLIDKNNNLIIFFQLLTNKMLNNTDAESDIIAWSYLKLTKDTCKNYFNKKIKLQLFESISLSNASDVYNCWKNKSWKIYPSSIQITIKGHKINKDDECVNAIEYSIHSLIKRCNKDETQSVNKIESYKTFDSVDYERRDDKEKCKIFNHIQKNIKIDGKSCFTMKFSNCGNYLAYTSTNNGEYFIVILKVPAFTQEAKLSKHKNIIYDLSWNSTNNMLVSASSDSTICVWEIIDLKFILKQQLKHESFVYSAKFCNVPENIIASGSFDKVVRVWLVKKDKNFTLHQKLNGHEGFINAVCFDKQNKMFYSGDSVGLIIKWNYSNGEWHPLLFIRGSEIRNNIINDLIIFPNNQKLLIVLRDSISWALDTSTNTLVLCYKDGINYRYQIRGCISPCGSFIFIGNCIWNATTAQLLGIYNPILFDNQIVTAIDYHPFYNITTISCGLIQSPILICVKQSNKIEDKNLNMDIFTYENENIQAQSSETSKNNWPSIPKRTEKDIQKFFGNFQTRVTEVNNSMNDTEIHSSKLWHLINKMDTVISTVKKANKFNNDKVTTVVKTENHLNKDTTDESLRQSKEICVLNKEEEEALKIDIRSQNSDVTYTIIENCDNSTLSEAESIHTYTVSPKHEIK